MCARLVLVLLFITLWVTLFPLGYPMPYGFLVALLAEAATLVFFLRAAGWSRTAGSLDRNHHALLFLELGFHTAMFYYLGGVSWLGSIAYLYALMYAAVFLSPRQAIAFTVLVGIAFLSIVSLDARGVLPHQWYLPQGPDRYKDLDFLFTTSVAFLGVIATVTFWMVFIGNEMRRERDVALNANAKLVTAQAELRQLNEELEEKVAERTRVLAFRAEHDQLTGLLNRGSVTRRCQEALALARRGERPMAVIVADADNFKDCNDQGGHSYGDLVLRSLADCLRESSRESDAVGRLGGDEFLVLLPDASVRGALGYCRRLLDSIDQKKGAWHGGLLPFPSLSLGVAVFPDHSTDLDDLIRIADKAMYDAKALGGSRWKVGRSGSTFKGHQERHGENPEMAETADVAAD